MTEATCAVELAQLAEAPLGAQIDALAGRPVRQLRALWRARWRSEPPQIQSADLLMRLMAWRWQAAAFGELSTRAQKQIAAFDRQLAGGRALATPAHEALAPGTVLSRTWRGVAHHVTVLDRGFLHNGKTYATLSQTARAITGTRWSGPRFFALEEAAGIRRSAAAPAAASPDAEPGIIAR